MDINWRTVQLFLGPEGVSETSVAEHDSSKIRCTCKAFSMNARCKHTRFVKERIDTTGHYEISIPVEVSDETAIEALSDPSMFRDFVIKYGKVEVIDD